MNDDLLNQLLQGTADPTKSFSVQQFAEMFKEFKPSAGANTTTVASNAESSPRNRARRSSANPTTSSGSGKTSEEIWKNIQLSGADSLQGPPSILPTPQGSGALGTLRDGLSIPTGSMLFPQKSIERLVDEHASGDKRPASEWMDMMLASLPSAPKGLQPTRSAKLALENAAAELVGASVGPPVEGSPGGLGRRASVSKRGASVLGKPGLRLLTSGLNKDVASSVGVPVPAAGLAAKGKKDTAAVGKKRLRDALHENATTGEAPVFALPPKKKGRKKKGEVDTETEEEKALRAEERQRKNRESAARSHRRKAELAGALEKRAVDAENKCERLEKEVARLKAELAKLRGKK